MASDERAETAKRAELTKETNERSAEKNELVREGEMDSEQGKACCSRWLTLLRQTSVKREMAECRYGRCY
jgi:polyhydroxyalkanoate synthesis regulator phasin